MLAMAVPGILLFSVFFGFVGLFVGMKFFVVAAGAGLAASSFGLAREHLRRRSVRSLASIGTAVSARCDRRERAGIKIWGATPVRYVCIGEAPEPFHGATFRSDWFVDRRGDFQELPDLLTVMVTPERPDRYHVVLRPFEVSSTRFGWRALIVPAGIMALGLTAIITGTLAVGEGPRGLRPEQAEGQVTASGHALGTWSFQASSCSSGEARRFFGVSVFDADHSDQQLTLVRDRAQGDMLDVDIPGQDKTFRFLPGDCAVFNAELRPMNSVVNRITNMEGRLDAECEAYGDRLSAHITFQSCH